MTNRAELEVRRMEARAKFPYLIHIYNEDYGDFFYANCDEEIEFENETYVPAWFEFSPPERKESSIGNSSITISALPDEQNGSWIEKIRGTQARSTAEVVGVIVYDNDGEMEVEECERYVFTLTNARWNELSITWDMIFDEDMNILIPCGVCSSTVTPGCA